MTTTLDGQEFQAELKRLDALVQESGRFADPAAQTHLRALVQAVLRLHGAGLEHILGHLEAAGDAGRAVFDACVRDEVVEGLLLLHGLHPLDLETRVRQGLVQVAPALRSHGAAVELVGVNGGVVRLRLQGGCDSCSSSAATIQQTIEEAIYHKAPEAAAVEIEGLTARPAAAENGHTRVPLPMF